MIPSHIKIRRRADLSDSSNPFRGRQTAEKSSRDGVRKNLPDAPGVYLYFDAQDKILYVGKATSLKKRVGSYFTKAHSDRISELVSKIKRIDYIQTNSVIEALVLEANKIREHRPYFNILLKDDKSFLYLVITNELYPKPLLRRGLELEREGIKPFQKELSARTKKKYLAVYGPYTSGTSLKRALDLVRKAIPWSVCDSPEKTGKNRPCFNAHLNFCPGVCTGAINPKTYRKIIRQLMLFFAGKKVQLLGQMRRRMTKLAQEERFEEAEVMRRKVFALEHIQDIALITKEDVSMPYSAPQDFIIDFAGRIEAYDISNISGTNAVGSMVVFENGEPAKNKYRKFKIKTVVGANDVAMMEEIVRRR
ncbi:MAG: GIY-YIG nuclease family protein, partial [Patescibacteria group bacterium]